MAKAAALGERTQTGGAIGRFCGRIAVLLLVSLLAPANAFAHAALVKADPADGAMLADAPGQVLLTFSEPVAPLVLTLIRPDGSAVALNDFNVAGPTVRIDMPGTLSRGTHVLSWRVVSADGHPVGGSLLFSVGAASTPPAVSDPVDRTLRAAIWVGKVVLYIGLFLGIGGTFANAWLAGGRRHGEAAIALALLAGLVAAPLSLGLQGLDALGAPLARFTEPAIWQAAMETSFRWTVLVAFLSLAVALFSFAVPRPLSRGLSAVSLLGVGAALAASGHASAAEPQWLTRPMVFLHGTAIGFWAGALLPLALALKRHDPDVDGFLSRFSRTIPAIVALLVVAGVVLAVIQVRHPVALLATAYGNLLLGKLVLVTALFALAAFNRWRLTSQEETPARRSMMRSIALETIVMAAIFGVAAGWRFTPPPRALEIAAAQPVSTHIHTLKAMADFSVTPGRAGPAVASMVLMTGDFGPLDAKEVTLVLSKPDAGIEPIRRAASKPGDGTWQVKDLIIPLPGRWNARIDILVSDFDMVSIEGSIDIRP